MSGINIEDFKQVLLDLYLAQREIVALRARVTELELREEQNEEA